MRGFSNGLSEEKTTGAVPVREKISYGPQHPEAVNIITHRFLGMFLTSYLTYFRQDSSRGGRYHDSVGPAFFDGASDIIMGGIIDKTKTRYGEEARPWLLISAPFTLVSLILTFQLARPPMSDTAKLVYIISSIFSLTVSALPPTWYLMQLLSRCDLNGPGTSRRWVDQSGLKPSWEGLP